MPLQNRVLPTGEIVVDPARGAMTGNRGILHGPDQKLGTARWQHKAWICCVLDWQGRKRPVMTGRNWTELFFLDEAVAFAAGHRPCAYCRRADFNRFQRAWTLAHGQDMRAPQVDAVLHANRVTRTRQQVTHWRNVNELPDGVFVRLDGQPHLIWEHILWPYTPAGYGNPRARIGQTQVEALTPAPLVDLLSAGYRPMVTLPVANH